MFYLNLCKKLSLFFLLICLTGCSQTPKNTGWTTDVEGLRYAKFTSAKDVDELFKYHKVSLSGVRRTDKKMPRVLFKNLPKDMHTYSKHHTRRELFVLSILPLILKVNEDIHNDRKFLVSLKESKKPLSAADYKKIKHLSWKYKLKTTNIHEMLHHIDIIPPSLAVAQAGLETGWGSSYAARKKNSLFGMTISGEVKGYDTLHESTWAYMRNLNYNQAYKKFRTLRAKMRKENKPFDSVVLSASLTEYCEFRDDYLRDLKLILNQFALADLDQLGLHGSKLSA